MARVGSGAYCGECRRPEQVGAAGLPVAVASVWWAAGLDGGRNRWGMKGELSLASPTPRGGRAGERQLGRIFRRVGEESFSCAGTVEGRDDGGGSGGLMGSRYSVNGVTDCGGRDGCRRVSAPDRVRRRPCAGMTKSRSRRRGRMRAARSWEQSSRSGTAGGIWEGGVGLTQPVYIV